MSGSQQKEIQKLRRQVAEVQPLLDMVRSGKLELIRETIEVAQYSGPIPSPQMLKEYDEVCDGLAEEIKQNFLAESRHRRELERNDQAFAHSMYGRAHGKSVAGLALGGFAFLGFLVLAFYLASMGLGWQAVAVAGAVATVVGAFILGSQGLIGGKGESERFDL